MKKVSLLFILMIAVVFSQAQTKKAQDMVAIRSMCGCYEVGFNFSETFEYVDDSTYQGSPVKHDRALEYVFEFGDTTDDVIQLQHLLIVGPKDQPYIVKHWRQDWFYEHTELYSYNGDNYWTFVSLSPEEVSGQWTQKVYQVDDSPRYEGSASWVSVDGKTYWEDTTDAPLPRRERTIRGDYNVMERTSRHEITENGWIHDQDNKKIIRKDGSDTVIAEEKGVNTYNQVDSSRCQAAIDWWEENSELWKKIRASFNELYKKNKDIHLKVKVDDKRMYEQLFSLDSSATKEDIDTIIESYSK